MTVGSSSMKRIISPFDLWTSSIMTFNRLELSAEFGTGDHRSPIERDDFFPVENLGYILFTIFCANPSTIAVFPTPASPIKTGFIFCAAAKNLHHTQNFYFTPSNGSSLPSRACWVRSRSISAVFYSESSPACSVTCLPSRILTINS